MKALQIRYMRSMRIELTNAQFLTTNLRSGYFSTVAFKRTAYKIPQSTNVAIENDSKEFQMFSFNLTSELIHTHTRENPLNYIENENGLIKIEMEH